ncbi:MAG: putative amidohydrolase [Myxococcota bacterium]|jgi:predicted amidohydrolase
MFLAAAVQLTSTSDEATNLSVAQALIRRAAGFGATLVVTPEQTNYLGPHAEKVRRAQPIDGPLVQGFCDLARELSITLVLGSFNEASDEPSRCYNTSVAIGPDGKLIAAYRKIHLFDVDHSDTVRFRESSTCKPGTEPVVAETAVGQIGMSICYDLRFPELYRHYVDHGATLLTVPSAFTLTTGKDHWHALLRARAIETQCYVIAPGQHGHHDDGGLRESYGHSMIIDPWGQIIGMCPDGDGLALAEVDPRRTQRIRAGMPLAQHRRL